MSEPKKVKRLKCDPHLSLAGLHEFADSIACSLQDIHKQAPFLFIFKSGGVLDLYEGRWESDDEKYATFDAFRGVLTQFPEITAYAFIMEAWLAAYPIGEPRATARVENDPRRQSALLITARDRGGGKLSKTYFVTYDEAGKPSRKDANWQTGQFGGYTENLFAPPAPLPEGLNKVADA
jgi:hypothetical protein